MYGGSVGIKCMSCLLSVWVGARVGEEIRGVFFQEKLEKAVSENTKRCFVQRSIFGGDKGVLEFLSGEGVKLFLYS